MKRLSLASLLCGAVVGNCKFRWNGKTLTNHKPPEEYGNALFHFIQRNYAYSSPEAGN